MSNDYDGHQARVIPFGKYKGQPTDILANDPKYTEWLSGQGWVKDKYPQFYTVIINNFQEPSDTPEHNALQAMFLDDSLCMKFLSVLSKTSRDEPSLFRLVSKEFEANGVDVYLRYNIYDIERLANITKKTGCRIRLKDKDRYWDGTSCGIEIKPSIGDDFPAVLRTAMRMRVNSSSGLQRCVLFRDFTATSVTVDQVREMFTSSGVYLFSLAEIQQTEIDTLFEKWLDSHKDGAES